MGRQMGSIAFPIAVLLIDPNKEDRQYYSERLTINSRAFYHPRSGHGSGRSRLVSIATYRLRCSGIDASGYVRIPSPQPFEPPGIQTRDSCDSVLASGPAAYEETRNE